MKETRAASPAKRRRNSSSESCAALQAKQSAAFPPRAPSAGGLGLAGGLGGAEFDLRLSDVGFKFEEEGLSSVPPDGIGSGASGSVTGGGNTGGSPESFEDELSGGRSGNVEEGVEIVPSCLGDGGVFFMFLLFGFAGIHLVG